MAAPKIKIHKLPAGYSQAGDNDIRQETGDELVPIKDKPIVPADSYPLSPVGFKDEELSPLSYDEGMYEAVLMSPAGEVEQAPSTAHMDIYCGPNPAFSPMLMDHDLVEIPPSGYVATPSGVRFLSAAPHPSGCRLTYWRTAAAPCQRFIGSESAWYSGPNRNFTPVVKDILNHPLPGSSVVVNHSLGLVSVPSASGVRTSYCHSKTVTKYFVAHSGNWINDHLYLSPDIFRGTCDYPGDDTLVPGGQPIHQGPIPQFVEQSEYSIDFRRGLVTFAAEFDSESSPARASFAHIAGTMNATGQVLEKVKDGPDEWRFKASQDDANPWSVGAQWVGRKDTYTPRNVYVDGELKPKIQTMSPPDILTIRRS